MELAMGLATHPKMLLLDEPMAGMGAEDTRRMTDLITRNRSGLAILMIEHDMDSVFALADRISVLVGGRIVESGVPERIRRSDAVREAYLGDGDA